METTTPRRRRKIVATSHVDRHGERLSRTALAALAEQLRTHYVPVGYEHDPRFPPLGRMIDADVTDLADGEVAAEAVIEFWDTDPTKVVVSSDSREIPLLVANAGPAVLYDRSFQDADSAGLLAEIGTILGSPPERVAKKGIDPVSVLTLVLGTFAVGGIAQGFFGRLGEDAYGALKVRLVKLYERRKKCRGLIQIVVATTGAGDRYVEWVVIAESPKQAEIEHLLERVAAALDRDASRVSEQLAHLREPRRVVFTWRKRRLVLLHILDVHGVPIAVYDMPQPRSRINHLLHRNEQAGGQMSVDPVHYTDAEDASSAWRAFDVVLVEDGASRNVPDLGSNTDDD